MAGGDEALGDERMSQTNNDIFPKEEKEKAKRKKIVEMNAVTAQAILKIILAQLGAKYEQYHFIKYCVLIIPIGNSGIEISLSDSAVIDQRQIIQDKLTKLYDFISGGASVGEVVTYCRDNRIEYLGYKARKYAVIDKISKEINISSFESAFVTEGVTSIGEDAFWFCESLKSIQLPEGVTSIGKGAFSGCKSLESIQLSEGVTSIGRSAFSGCKSLKSIQLPEGVTSIGDAAFRDCESLKSIELPAEVKSIGKDAFSNCFSLESIQLPEGVTSIGEGAFAVCTSLKSIQLPKGVTSIGRQAFYCCRQLKSI
ncbi:MAG: leucine-rich repeat domain-containing protein, partial [Spirochaetales bacterium]|nr:leucine-rich repeat domain-containing protein [Spirochaetales bacterium]